MVDVIAPPADRPVMWTRAGSMPWRSTIAPIMAAIEAASPCPRAVSFGWNQLKHRLGLLARVCSGKQQRESVALGQTRPAAAAIEPARGLRAAVQHHHQPRAGRQIGGHVAVSTKRAGIGGEVAEGLQTVATGGRTVAQARQRVGERDGQALGAGEIHHTHLLAFLMIEPSYRKDLLQRSIQSVFGGCVACIWRFALFEAGRGRLLGAAQVAVAPHPLLLLGRVDAEMPVAADMAPA